MNTNGKIALGVGGAALLFGLAWWMADDDSSSGSSSGSGSGSGGGSGSGSTEAPTLEQTAASLRAQYLEVTGCDIIWASPGAKVGLESHVTDFFSPAVARARSGGATSIDEITIAIAQMLVPGCPQPPESLAHIDIDAALQGQASPAIQQQMFDMSLPYGVVQFYLSVRGVVATLMATARGR